MNNQESKAIDRSDLPDSLLVLERRKSNLILEANLLKQQGIYPSAADRFAEAAQIEEQITKILIDRDKLDKAFTHRFSAISCWVQAGDLHRALGIGQHLLSQKELPETQQSQLEAYIDTLQERMSQWMSHWSPHPLVAAD